VEVIMENRIEPDRPAWFSDLLTKARKSIREGFESCTQERRDIYIRELTDYREMLTEALGLGPIEIEEAMMRELTGYVTEDRYH
jgi:hypothetical protein